MHVLIIGTGGVGETLGKRFAEIGHRVTFVSRTPADNSVGYDDIPIDIDISVVALPYSAAVKALDPIAGDLAGTILLDVTNPFKADGTYGVEGSSGAEEIANIVPAAKVVKAFNMMGKEVMLNPVFGDQNADLFICGDDASAKQTITDLTAEMGFRALDVGELTMARYLEAMTVVWIALSRKMHRNIGWKILER